MRTLLPAVLFVIVLSATSLHAQNCCAPSVPQQGLLGETAALPKTLEIGLHYQYLRSRGFYDGSESIQNPDNRESDWNQAVVTAAYGIRNGLSITAIAPYVWKHRTEEITDLGWELDRRSDGIGDITLLVRFSPITRSFVTFRELSFGLGVKMPTGSADRKDDQDILLIEELQPGSGSWDFHGSVSFYQGFELVDFIVAATYIMTTKHDKELFGTQLTYEYGDQFSYLAASNFHVGERVDLSTALSGMVRERDRENGNEIYATGRHQLWFVPGIKVQVVPYLVGLQLYLEHPIYQHFNGRQLGSDYNIRLSTVLTIPLESSEKSDR